MQVQSNYSANELTQMPYLPLDGESQPRGFAALLVM